MPEHRPPRGRPLAVDRNAASAASTEPAFAARPKGAPVYQGFRVLEDVEVEGFTFGAITDFEAAVCDRGDAFVIAPDGSRAGLVWEVTSNRYFEQLLPFDENRWSVWAVSFTYAMKSREDARRNLAAVMHELKARWEQWKQSFPRYQ